MGNLARLFIFLCGVMFVMMIIKMLLKGKISEQNSIFWLAGCFIILILSAFPRVLEVCAKLLGIDYPPALLFLGSNLVLLYLLLYQSIQISVLNNRLNELTQQFAVKMRLTAEGESKRDNRNQSQDGSE